MKWYKAAENDNPGRGPISVGFQHWHLDTYRDQNYWKLYAYDENTPKWDVVGYLEYSDLEDKIYIDHIFVNPGFRRQGIGTALVRELERKAKEEGLEIVHGMMTDEGSALYQSMQDQS